MKVVNMLLAATAAAGMFAVSSSTARADEWNQLTQVTFDNPVQISDTRVLQPGTYWLQTLDRDAFPSPNLVVVYNEDQTRVEATLLTRPVEASSPAPDTEFTMAEQGLGQPSALLTWFYPGKMVGHQFVYSDAEQHRLDEANFVTVSQSKTGF